ncbi:MAG: AI-2E family transporter [Devosia sp.]|uniref:AI-2E family transporter n=1 Tax=Devosia sp. TaxID=1871048 RepID=UPI001AD49BD7|nr:AI-2E family transporter [Devosia sp.]MBN9316510.1 AI-2E family transporter [Devosia sp.]
MRKPLTAARRKALAADIARTNFERVMHNAAQMAIILVGIVVAFVAIREAQVILAPLFLAITIGLAFGPVADMLENRGIPEGVSAAVVVLGLLLVIVSGGALFYGPLSEWADRIPVIWSRLQTEMRNWQEPISALTNLQEQVKGVLGGQDKVEVRVDDGSTVTGIAMLAPAVFAQVLVFLVSLYFFLATRESIRIATLSLCFSRRMRWRAAHVFQDVEQKVSKYLLTITMVNIGVGVVVTVLMWIIGMPSPILWGAMAAVLNYVPFVGQAFMALLLFLAGLGSGGSLGAAFVPVGLYWAVNFVEGNFVTPNLLGATMTVNPFLIFLSLTFWLWAWGPVGGLIAVPSLLIVLSLITHILPMRPLPSRKERLLVRQKARLEVAEAQPVAASPEPSAAVPAARKRPSRAKAAATP